MKKSVFNLWARVPKRPLIGAEGRAVYARAQSLLGTPLECGKRVCLGQRAMDLIAIVAMLSSGVESKSRERDGPEF